MTLRRPRTLPARIVLAAVLAALPLALARARPAAAVSHAATWFVVQVPHSVPDRDPSGPFLVDVFVQAWEEDTELWVYRATSGAPFRVLHATLAAGEVADLADVEDTRGRTYTVIASRPVAVRIEKVAANRHNASYTQCVDRDTPCVDCHADLVPSPWGGNAGKDFFLYPGTRILDGGLFVLAHEDTTVRVHDRTLDPGESSPLETFLGSGVRSIALAAGEVATENGAAGLNRENLLDWFNSHHLPVAGQEGHKDRRGHVLHVVSTGLVSLIEGGTETGPATWFGVAGPDPASAGGGRQSAGLGTGTSFVLPLHVVHHTHHALESPRKGNSARILLFSFEDRPVRVRVSDTGGGAPLPILASSPSLSLPSPQPPGTPEGDATVFTIPSGGWIELQSDQSSTLLPFRGDSRCASCSTPGDPCYFLNGARDSCDPATIGCEPCVPPGELGAPDYDYAVWRVEADGKIGVQKASRVMVGCNADRLFGPSGTTCAGPSPVPAGEEWLCDECDFFHRCPHDWRDPACPVPPCDPLERCLDPVKEMQDRVVASGAFAPSLDGRNRLFRTWVSDDPARYYRDPEDPTREPAAKVHLVIAGSSPGTLVEVRGIGAGTDPSVPAPKVLLWTGTVGVGEARDPVAEGADVLDRAIEVTASAPITVWSHLTGQNFDNDSCRREGASNTFAYADAVPERLEPEVDVTVIPDCEGDRLESVARFENRGARPAWNLVARTLLPEAFGPASLTLGCGSGETAVLGAGDAHRFSDGSVGFRAAGAVVLARATGSSDDGDGIPEDPALWFPIDPALPADPPAADDVPHSEVVADFAANSFRLSRTARGLSGWNRPHAEIVPGLDPSEGLPSDNVLCSRISAETTADLSNGPWEVRTVATWSHSLFVAQSGIREWTSTFVRSRPDLSSEKTWEAETGGGLRFTVAARNGAPPGGTVETSSAHGTTVLDDLAGAGLTLSGTLVETSVDGGATWTPHDALTLGWWDGSGLRIALGDVGLGDLAPDGEIRVRFRALPTGSLPAGKALCEAQRAFVEWESCGTPFLLAAAQPCPAPEKSARPACGTPLRTGDRLAYDLAVSNAGEATARNVTLADRVPEGTVLVPGSAPGAVLQGDLLTWTWAEIEPGGARSASFEVDVTACCGRIRNEATVACEGIAPWTTPACEHPVSEPEPPEVTILHPEDGACYGREIGPAEVAADFADNCTPAAELATAREVRALSHCDREATASATDCAGNTGSARVGFVVDTEPPEPAITNLSGGDCYGREFAPGDVAVSWADDCTAVAALGKEVTVTALDACNREARARGTDCGGNSGETAVRYVSDTTPPVVELLLEDGALLCEEPAAGNLPWTVRDDCTDVRDIGMTLVREALQPARCLERLTLSATDCGGNTGSDSATAVVDLEPPALDCDPDPVLRCVGASNCEPVAWETILRHCRIQDCTGVALVPGSFAAEVLSSSGSGKFPTIACRDGRGGCAPGETKHCSIYLYDEAVFLHKDPHAKPLYRARISFDVADSCGQVSRGALLFDVVHDDRENGPCNPGSSR